MLFLVRWVEWITKLVARYSPAAAGVTYGLRLRAALLLKWRRSEGLTSVEKRTEEGWTKIPGLSFARYPHSRT